jgi:hypothetical protein
MNWQGILTACLLPASVAWAEVVNPAAVIQTVELNAGRPYFVPTHPRVTTTVRFPQEIGAPDGAVSVFTEDAAKPVGEYLVTWQQGDAYFTLTPLKDARMANLNVPYQGRTYVFYFYPVAEPLAAIASVNLVSTASEAGPPAASPALPPGATMAPSPNSPSTPEFSRQMTPPADETAPATPARLLGMLDRLKLIHATPRGAALNALVRAMGVEIATTPEDTGGSEASATGRPADGRPAAAEIASGMNDAGLYQILLLRAVRDPRINCVGFICLLRNTSDRALAFDVNSFGARAGAEYLMQRVSDAPPILQPGAQCPAYFVIAPPRQVPLRAANEWKISADLVSPRTNPGAGIARAFRAPDPRP